MIRYITNRIFDFYNIAMIGMILIVYCMIIMICIVFFDVSITVNELFISMGVVVIMTILVEIVYFYFGFRSFERERRARQLREDMNIAYRYYAVIETGAGPIYHLKVPVEKKGEELEIINKIEDFYD